MDNSVTIKGYKNGIILMLDDSVPFPELLQKVHMKFKDSAKFLGNAKMALTFDGRELSNAEQKEILAVISETTELEIICVFDNNEENDAILKRSIDQVISSLSNQTGQFFQGVLRSGQQLESENSIVIIGNVEKGARIVSGGNIVVIGALEGSALAGTNSNKESFIFAAHMLPEHLQINKLVYIPPERNKREQKKADKLEHKLQLVNCSKMACIEGGELKVFPVERNSMGCTDELLQELL